MLNNDFYNWICERTVRWMGGLLVIWMDWRLMDWRSAGWTDSRMGGRTDWGSDGWTNWRSDGQTDGWMDGRLDRLMVRWMTGLMIRWTVGWMDGWMNKHSHRCHYTQGGNPWNFKEKWQPGFKDLMSICFCNLHVVAFNKLLDKKKEQSLMQIQKAAIGMKSQ